VLYLAEVRLYAEGAAHKSKLSPESGIKVGCVLLIQQWADGKSPIGSFGCVVLSMADRLDNEALTSNCRDLATTLTVKRDS
jgi:hypothetical protein